MYYVVSAIGRRMTDTERGWAGHSVRKGAGDREELVASLNCILLRKLTEIKFKCSSSSSSIFVFVSSLSRVQLV